MVITVVGVVVMLFVVLIFVSDLVRTVDGEIPGAVVAVEATRWDTLWAGVFSSCHNIISKAIPLTAVKIVVVVWQIVTQVCNGPGLWGTHMTCNSEVVSGIFLKADCSRYLPQMFRIP